jgi:hypothetical protein
MGMTREKENKKQTNIFLCVARYEKQFCSVVQPVKNFIKEKI